MRIIDADAIQYTHAIARSIEDGHNWNELCVTKDDIDAAPTIAAIPVEWLREKMQKPQMTCANPFGYVLAEWLEEQEAR